MDTKQNGGEVFKTSIGGQALIEGVMMRGPHRLAYAVRSPQGAIVVQDKPMVQPAWKKKIPLLRGVVAFVESLLMGYQYLTKSAEIALADEPTEPPSRFEQWLERYLGARAERVLMVLASLAGAGVAIALFMVLPTLLVGLADTVVSLGGWKTLAEGIVKIAVLVSYLALIGRVPDVHRMFQYHGAEHKTIACYESGLALTVENARGCSRLHPRCGTSFLLIVLIVSVVLFSAVSWDSLLLRILYKLLLLPLVMGISYEILKLCGRYDCILTRVVSAPGLWLQHITTQEPEDGMLECAIAAIEPVLPARREDGAW